MKKVLHRIFGFSETEQVKESQPTHSSNQDANQHPDLNIPKTFTELDEEFAYRLTQQGGKFIYCATHQELVESIAAITKQWKLKNLACYEQSIKALLSTIQEEVQITKATIADVFICNCESLIASDGRIMVTSIQTGYNKVCDLPEKVIVIAKTSQLVNNMGEGLTQINFRHKKNIPGQITSIRNKNSDNSGIDRPNDKQLFILMIEDYNQN